MTDLQSIFQHYRRRYPFDPGFADELSFDKTLRTLIVIPAYDEDLVPLMESLAVCTNHQPGAEVLLVFNNAQGDDIHSRHQEQKQYWHGKRLVNDLRIQAIAALNLPPKKAGVGLARKIGMDAALQAFADFGHDGLIVCLDGDCTVSANYLEELLRVEDCEVNGLSIYFEHALDGLSPERADQIIAYESWLRYYVQALRSIGYPHAYHTVGSSMAVRASMYARIGGMNQRKAGEDFYFLHKLMPQGNFQNLLTTTVYPSSRDSLRVPFGTGRAMLDMREGRKDFQLVYNPEIFKHIRPLVQEPANVIGATGKELFPVLWEAIIALNWQRDLSDLHDRSTSSLQFSKNFQYWFNGFRMLKLVHWLQAEKLPDVLLQEACSTLLNINAENHISLLKKLRDLDRLSTS